MNNYQTQLSEIEEKVDNAKIEQAKLQERKNRLEQEKTEILEELKKEGIETKDLQDKIMDLEVSIEMEINKCEQILK